VLLHTAVFLYSTQTNDRASSFITTIQFALAQRLTDNFRFFVCKLWFSDHKPIIIDKRRQRKQDDALMTDGAKSIHQRQVQMERNTIIRT
jgi:hypothetical protein